MMQLAKHLAQGRLVYLSQEEHAITVSENEHFRWLAFEDVVQSVMLKRKPWQLTLPHQTAMMLPLLFFKPKNVIELGLGGGNLARFLTQQSSELSFTSIENNEWVINCFKKHFNPDNKALIIKHTNSFKWLQQPNNEDLDWLICDVYQQKSHEFEQTIQQLERLVDKLNHNACLTINLPDVSDEEINLSLTILKQIQTSHHIFYFHIPNYLNIIIQLIPKHWPLEKALKRNKQSYLAKHTFLRWRSFWQHGKKV